MANPVASVVLVLLLIGDSLTVPSGWRGTPGGSLVQGAINFMFGRVRINDPVLKPDWVELYVVRGPESLRVIDPAVDSWDELSALFSAGDVPIAACVLTDNTSLHGFWAWTTERHFRGAVIAPSTGKWSKSDLAEARRTIFLQDRLAPASWSAIQPWTDVAAGDQREVRVLWGGVAHDALALVLFMLLLYSFTGWPAWFAAHPLSRRARRRARGLCPACGYDLRGIESDRCPECGNATEPRA